MTTLAANAPMIFVTVGTTHFQFDRLIAGVATLETDEEIVVQRGPSRVPAGNARVVDFLSFGELADYIRRSRVVVSHAGVGSIMVAPQRRPTADRRAAPRTLRRGRR